MPVRPSPGADPAFVAAVLVDVTGDVHDKEANIRRQNGGESARLKVAMVKYSDTCRFFGAPAAICSIDIVRIARRLMDSFHDKPQTAPASVA